MSCPICLHQSVSFCIIPCGHCLCKTCIKKVKDCPMCRGKIKKTQRLFLEKPDYNPDNNFINLTISNFEFLKDASPKNSNKITDIGLALAPLFKVIKYEPTLEELKIIMKFFVPTFNINSDATVLISILPEDFADFFHLSMLRRYQMIKNYGSNFLVNTLNEKELNQITNMKINRWLNNYTFASYPGEAVLFDEEITIKPKLDKREHILNRQLEILNSKSCISVKRMALLTMRQLYKLDLNGSLPFSSDDEVSPIEIDSTSDIVSPSDIDSSHEIHSSDESIILETALDEISDEILTNLGFEQDGLIFD